MALTLSKRSSSTRTPKYRQRWTREEDLGLVLHVAERGTNCWGSLKLRGKLPLRDNKACCNRFILLKKRHYHPESQGEESRRREEEEEEEEDCCPESPPEQVSQPPEPKRQKPRSSNEEGLRGDTAKESVMEVAAVILKALERLSQRGSELAVEADGCQVSQGIVGMSEDKEELTPAVSTRTGPGIPLMAPAAATTPLGVQEPSMQQVVHQETAETGSAGEAAEGARGPVAPTSVSAREHGFPLSCTSPSTMSSSPASSAGNSSVQRAPSLGLPPPLPFPPAPALSRPSSGPSLRMPPLPHTTSHMSLPPPSHSKSLSPALPPLSPSSTLRLPLLVTTMACPVGPHGNNHAPTRTPACGPTGPPTGALTAQSPTGMRPVRLLQIPSFVRIGLPVRSPGTLPGTQRHISNMHGPAGAVAAAADASRQERTLSEVEQEMTQAGAWEDFGVQQPRADLSSSTGVRSEGEFSAEALVGPGSKGNPYTSSPGVAFPSEASEPQSLCTLTPGDSLPKTCGRGGSLGAASNAGQWETGASSPTTNHRTAGEDDTCHPFSDWKQMAPDPKEVQREGCESGGEGEDSGTTSGSEYSDEHSSGEDHSDVESSRLANLQHALREAEALLARYREEDRAKAVQPATETILPRDPCTNGTAWMQAQAPLVPGTPKAVPSWDSWQEGDVCRPGGISQMAPFRSRTQALGRRHVAMNQEWRRQLVQSQKRTLPASEAKSRGRKRASCGRDSPLPALGESSLPNGSAGGTRQRGNQLACPEAAGSSPRALFGNAGDSSQGIRMQSGVKDLAGSGFRSSSLSPGQQGAGAGKSAGHHPDPERGELEAGLLWSEGGVPRPTSKSRGERVEGQPGRGVRGRRSFEGEMGECEEGRGVDKSRRTPRNTGDGDPWYPGEGSMAQGLECVNSAVEECRGRNPVGVSSKVPPMSQEKGASVLEELLQHCAEAELEAPSVDLSARPSNGVLLS